MFDLYILSNLTSTIPQAASMALTVAMVAMVVMVEEVLVASTGEEDTVTAMFLVVYFLLPKQLLSLVYLPYFLEKNRPTKLC